MRWPPRVRPPRLPRPDLNEALVIVGLPVCGVGLWQLAHPAFWAGMALLGALAASWGVYRAGRA